MTTPALDVSLEWKRLDRRMLLVHPVKEVGRFLPALVVLLLFGRSSGAGGLWGLLGVAVPLLLGFARYVTTSYRLDAGRVELRHGLFNKQVTSAPIDRVRTVDVTATPIHRLLGLVTLRIGTGHTSRKDDDRLDLDGLSVAAAEQLRQVLLHTSLSADPSASTQSNRRVVLTLDPRWVRFAPLTTSGLVIAGATFGFAAQAMHTFAWSPSLHPGHLMREHWWLLIPLVTLVGLVALCLLAVVGYLVTNWGFQLAHTRSDGSWHLRRGLFTTRETSLDDARVSGVSIGEPLGLRLARGARLSAIVSGLDRHQRASSVLVPPAPRSEVDRVAVEVVGTPSPVMAPLTGHGARARTRRYTRALVPAGLVALAAVGAAYDGGTWLVPLVVVAPLVGLGLAVDRTRALGHAVVDGHLVARSGSLNRRREALATHAVIGWNLRSSFFQRRAGLVTLTATTAGGRQRVTILDVPEHEALRIARGAPGVLLDQFLA